MKALIQLLHNTRSLSPELKAHLEKKIKPYRFKKGKDIVTKGEVPNLILYLEKGLIRSYVEVNGKMANNYFMRAGDIIISVKAFLEQKPAEEWIEALEACLGWGITWGELEEIYEKFPEFNIHGRLILQRYYGRSEDRHHSRHRLNTPEQMYAWLMETDPELVSRVLDKHMQSYLGVSRQTYYRIKKDFSTAKGPKQV